MLEHGAYTLLMDAIYDREVFPTLDEALDWAWARDDAEIAAVKFVLSKFFELQDDGRYVQKRIQDELADYKAKAKTNTRIAKEREAKRKSKNEASRNVHEACEEKHEASPNHKPLTNNQEPITSNQYIYTFDLETVNVNLMKAGRKKIDQKYIDELQPQFELYYSDSPMRKNIALTKFVQWIMRNQDQASKQGPTPPAKQNKWSDYFNNMGQASEELDVSPKKTVLIEEVGHA